MAFDAPYYLDTTEISKLTAYFGVYSTTAPFLETAVRALFREFSPVGRAAGHRHRHQLRADQPAGAGARPDHPSVRPVRRSVNGSGSIQVGSHILLETGVILTATATRCPTARRSSFTCATRPRRCNWRPVGDHHRRQGAHDGRAGPAGRAVDHGPVRRGEGLDPHRAEGRRRHAGQHRDRAAVAHARCPPSRPRPRRRRPPPRRRPPEPDRAAGRRSPRQPPRPRVALPAFLSAA